MHVPNAQCRPRRLITRSLLIAGCKTRSRAERFWRVADRQNLADAIRMCEFDQLDGDGEVFERQADRLEYGQSAVFYIVA